MKIKYTRMTITTITTKIATAMKSPAAKDSDVGSLLSSSIDSWRHNNEELLLGELTVSYV